MGQYNNLHAQNSIDTISLAKKIRDNHQFKKAADLLNKYSTNHPDQLNPIWLSAQTAFWRHKYTQSKEWYDKAIAAYPSNYYLKLDYAKVLADMGEFEKSTELLNSYLKYDPTNAEAMLTLAKIDFWQGNFKAAEEKINKILAQHPKYSEAHSLKDELLLAQSSWLSIHGVYNTDDQPLQTISPSIEAGYFFHPLASVHMNIEAPVFIKDGSSSNAGSVEIGNKATFYKQALTTDISVGMVKFPLSNLTEFRGNLSITKTFAKFLDINLSADRKPYFYSRSSIDTNIMENKFGMQASWTNKFSVHGTAGVLINNFPDNNLISTYYANIYSPVLKFNKINAFAGYGYNYSSAAENHFTPGKTFSEYSLDPTTSISGNYIPYFTPNQQQIHSIIASVDYQPKKNIQLGIGANYGFYATTQNPYFYPDYTSSSITKEYIEQQFSPAEINAYFIYKVSKKLNLKIAYQYHQSFFYTTQFVDFTLKANFWNEKK